MCIATQDNIKEALSLSLLIADYLIPVLSANHTKMNCGLFIFAIAISMVTAYPLAQGC